jgi:hypothetical protein
MVEDGRRVCELEDALREVATIHHRCHRGVAPSFGNCSVLTCQRAAAVLRPEQPEYESVGYDDLIAGERVEVWMCIENDDWDWEGRHVVAVEPDRVVFREGDRHYTVVRGTGGSRRMRRKVRRPSPEQLSTPEQPDARVTVGLRRIGPHGPYRQVPNIGDDRELAAVNAAYEAMCDETKLPDDFDAAQSMAMAAINAFAGGRRIELLRREVQALLGAGNLSYQGVELIVSDWSAEQPVGSALSRALDAFVAAYGHGITWSEVLPIVWRASCGTCGGTAVYHEAVEGTDVPLESACPDCVTASPPASRFGQSASEKSEQTKAETQSLIEIVVICDLERPEHLDDLLLDVQEFMDTKHPEVGAAVGGSYELGVSAPAEPTDRVRAALKKLVRLREVEEELTDGRRAPIFAPTATDRKVAKDFAWAEARAALSKSPVAAEATDAAQLREALATALDLLDADSFDRADIDPLRALLLGAEATGDDDE